MQPPDPVPTHDRRAWLATLLLQRPGGFLSRLATGLARWRALPRGYRRRLGRRAAASATGAALLLAMAGSPLLVPRAAAATIVVDGTTCTLVDAIQAANTNAAVNGCASGAFGSDTIDLQTDVTLTAVNVSFFGSTGAPVIDSEIVIEGNGHTIERDSTAPDFRILVVNASGDLTLRDVTLSGGWLSYGNGGGVYVRNGALRVYDSTISGNYADHGGGIANYNGTVTISRSQLTYNEADWNGGSVSNAYAMTTIADSTFTNNEAGYEGGAIVNYAGTVTVTNSTLSGNSAKGGGAIYNGFVSNANTTITNSTLSGNSAVYGGSVASVAGEVTITNSTLSGNSADVAGGIYVTGSEATITNSTLSGNDAVRAGGVFGNNATVEVIQTTISNNTATDKGGGVQVVGDIVLDLTNSTISGNDAKYGGGLHLSSDQMLTITNTTVTGNHASNEGGGIFLNAYTSLTLSRSIVSGNTDGISSAEILVGFFSGLYLDDHNVLSHAGLTNDDAFTGYVPLAGPTDFFASSDAGNVTLTGILDVNLADNGGPTLTHNLVANSPAVDQAPDADCAADPAAGVDQRGAARPFDVAGQGNDGADTCDAGAVEYLSPVPGAPAIFMSAKTAGTTGDGLAFRSDDILKWNGEEWIKWFDGQAAGLVPVKDKHNVNAFWIPDPDGEEVILSFAQNRWAVPGIIPKVEGTDLVRWDGEDFSLYFDGSDVGLTVKVAEKIDGLHVQPGDASPINGGACQAYLLISTQGAGKVPQFGGGVLKFRGEDVLGFCATNLGAATTGFWHMVLDGSAQGLPVNATDSLSVSEDGGTLYLTTKKAIAIPADEVSGGHSMVYAYDFGAQTFSGPLFKAAANGLPRQVDGLQVEGELP